MCNSLSTRKESHDYEMFGWKNCWLRKENRLLFIELRIQSKSERALQKYKEFDLVYRSSEDIYYVCKKIHNKKYNFKYLYWNGQIGYRALKQHKYVYVKWSIERICFSCQCSVVLARGQKRLCTGSVMAIPLFFVTLDVYMSCSFPLFVCFHLFLCLIW